MVVVTMVVARSKAAIRIAASRVASFMGQGAQSDMTMCQRISTRAIRLIERRPTDTMPRRMEGVRVCDGWQEWALRFDLVRLSVFCA